MNPPDFYRIPGTDAQARAIQGGTVSYCLWVDGAGALYVQITSHTGEGTFSGGLLFPVAKYASERESEKSLKLTEAYDINARVWKNGSGNRNNAAFLKAVLCHLLSYRTS